MFGVKDKYVAPPPGLEPGTAGFLPFVNSFACGFKPHPALLAGFLYHLSYGGTFLVLFYFKFVGWVF